MEVDQGITYVTNGYIKQLPTATSLHSPSAKQTKEILDNMKVFIIVSALLVVALAAEDKYTTKYDNINLEEILQSDRLLTNYYKCLMDTGPCTPDGTELKKVIPDALTNKCAKCNETQKKGAEKVIRFLIDNKPDMWKNLEKKYDPQGTYAEKYREEAKQHGINVQ